MDEKIKFGMLSLVIIIFQSVLKVYGVIMTGSLSFLSETVDTLTDIVFVAITLYSLSLSQKPPDYEHMYGHSKIDSIGAMVQGIILMILYVFLIGNALQVLIKGEYEITNPLIGLQILIISFIVNLIFSRVLIWEGRRRKSLSLEIQGLNLFQDSIRAILVIISFIFVLFNIFFLDIFFSIAISIWIIIGAFKLTKNGINELSDINPVNTLVLEDIRQNIFLLEHVNAIEDIKIRAFGRKLFLEVHLAVEDHISVVHAHEINKAIRNMARRIFPVYDVECTIEMNPLAGEKFLGDHIINLIYSLKTEFPKIINVKDLNIFRIEDEYFLSQIIVVNENLSLKEAHDLCSDFEKELKKEAPKISRIITHIESERESKILSGDQIECASVDDVTLVNIKEIVEDVLKMHTKVKGYHGFEFWTAANYCILELHIFFEGGLNISTVHENIEQLEQIIRDKLKIDNLYEIILHSEPLEGQKKGVIF